MAFGLAEIHGAAAPIPQAADSKGQRSVWDGVYTSAQAERGKTEYEYRCGSCHIHDLHGDPVSMVPALAGEDFIAVWGGKTLKELFEIISKTMPADSPGSLNAATYVDIMSYLLQVNEFPAGKEELKPEPDRLDRLVIEKERSGTEK